jgi:hypothetical protein
MGIRDKPISPASPWQNCHENGSCCGDLCGLELDDVAEPFQPALEVSGRTVALSE